VKARAAITVGALVIIDQLTKFLAAAHLKLQESRAVLKDVFHLTLVENSGAAFGFFKQRAAVFIFISIAAILLIIFYAKRFQYGYRYARTALILILAGTIGNLIDRIRLGCVVDFLDFRIWPVFNFADICISLGGLLLICHILLFKRTS
jgi:signal peptidase II